jgi:hypothetical protein
VCNSRFIESIRRVGGLRAYKCIAVVFADARGGLFMAVYKASDRSITVHRYKAVRCQLLYYSGGFIKVFANTRGVGVSL